MLLDEFYGVVVIDTEVPSPNFEKTGNCPGGRTYCLDLDLG